MNLQGVEIIPGDLTVKIDGDIFKTIEINDDLIESIVQSIIDFKEWREYVRSKKKIKMENNMTFMKISHANDILEDCYDKTQICKFVPNFRLLCTSPPINKEHHTNLIAGNFGPVIHRSASFSCNSSNFELKHKFVNSFLKFPLFTRKLNVSLKLSNVNVMSALFKKNFCFDISCIRSARKFYFNNTALQQSVTALLGKANICVDILGGLNSTSANLTVKKAVQTHENKSEGKAGNKNCPVNRHGDDLSPSNRDLIITTENNCDINKDNLFYVVAKDGRDAKEIDISTIKRNNSTISTDCKLKTNSHISESTKAKNSEHKVAPANEVKRSEIKEENGKYAKEIDVSTIKKNYSTIPTDYEIKNNSHLSKSAKTKNSEHKVAPASEAERSKVKEKNETFTEKSVSKKRSAPDFDTYRTGEVKKLKTGESDRKTADTTETTSTYKLGFEERRDNNDPKWQSQKFNSISDALDFMKNQWQVLHMSNPHVDMTTRFINSGKIHNKNQRKPLPQLTVSCAGLFDRQIDRVNNTIHDINKKIDALSDEYYSYSSYYSQCKVNNLTQQYTKEKELLENQYANLCDARNEVDQFYKFYNARWISQYQKNENDCQRKAILRNYYYVEQNESHKTCAMNAEYITRKLAAVTTLHSVNILGT